MKYNENKWVMRTENAFANTLKYSIPNVNMHEGNTRKYEEMISTNELISIWLFVNWNIFFPFILVNSTFGESVNESICVFQANWMNTGISIEIRMITQKQNLLKRIQKAAKMFSTIWKMLFWCSTTEFPLEIIEMKLENGFDAESI